MKGWKPARGYLITRAFLYSLAEILFVIGNGLPVRPAAWFYRWALALNGAHTGAALNRARAVAARGRHDAAWSAFETAVAVVRNSGRISASDMALAGFVGRGMRKAVGRALGAGFSSEERGRAQGQLVELAKEQFWGNIQRGNLERAAAAREVWESAAGATVEVRWAELELAWKLGERAAVGAQARELVERGDWVAPLDALKWARRLWEVEECRDVARRALAWAQVWTPERADVWLLKGRDADARGEREQAARRFERAAALEPDNVELWLARRNRETNANGPAARRMRAAEGVTLTVTGHDAMQVGETAELECALAPVRPGERWVVEVLPPAGWGVVAEPRVQELDGMGRCRFTVRAHRPDRVRGEVWSLTCIAASDNEYALARRRVAVPDTTAGQLLVLVTEDHELWEERGTITRRDVERLLVEKSEFAARAYAPWTHMVEVGSSLRLLDWAVEQDASWSETRAAVRAHLAGEAANGNDLQPHLHAFNVPGSAAFPYRMTGQGLAADDAFLLTPEEERRDFARAYSPHERITAVADAVARVEQVALAGDPDYHAVLWRSGQLEFGDSPEERSWSAVACLRAGLWGDSDIGRGERSAGEVTAFLADVSDPFAPCACGVLAQLPVLNNLEGDYIKEARALARDARQTAEALRGPDGEFKPGVHLVTLLTHDKFINARRGGDDLALGEGGDWATIRAHLSAWQAVGARRVTAREALRALVDDGAGSLRAWPAGAAWDAARGRVSYALELLGRNIPVSEAFPQSVLVTIPPVLRARVRGARAWQGEQELDAEWNSARDLWLRLTQKEAIRLELELAAPEGPVGVGTSGEQIRR